MTMITPSYLGETIEYSSLHACRSTLEDPTGAKGGAGGGLGLTTPLGGLGGQASASVGSTKYSGGNGMPQGDVNGFVRALTGAGGAAGCYAGPGGNGGMSAVGTQNNLGNGGGGGGACSYWGDTPVVKTSSGGVALTVFGAASGGLGHFGGSYGRAGTTGASPTSGATGTQGAGGGGGGYGTGANCSNGGNGAAGTEMDATHGAGGGGGAAGGSASGTPSCAGGNGGLYGGGGGAANISGTSPGNGAQGLIKITWPAFTPPAPSTFAGIADTNYTCLTTYWISPTGSDSNPGTLALPRQNPVTTFNALGGPGVCIRALAGTYTINNTNFQVTSGGGNQDTLTGYSALVCDVPLTCKLVPNTVSPYVSNTVYVNAAPNPVNFGIIDGFDIQGGSLLLGCGSTSSCGDSAVEIVYGHHWKVINNNLHDSAAAGLQTGWMDYLLLKNNHIYNNAWLGASEFSGVSTVIPFQVDSGSSYHYLLQNNHIWGNAMGSHILPNSGHTDGEGIILDTVGFQRSYSGPILVEQNLVTHNGHRGIEALCAGSQNVATGGIMIRYNTIWNNDADPNRSAANGELYNSGCSSVTMVNNVVSMNPDFTQSGVQLLALYNEFSGGTAVIQNNTFWCGVVGNSACLQTDAAVSNGVNGNQVGVIPLLTAPSLNDAVADWHVQTGSTLQNAGTTAFGFPPTDLAGNPRVVGGQTDMGAYEGGHTPTWMQAGSAFDMNFANQLVSTGLPFSAYLTVANSTGGTDMTVNSPQGYAYVGYIANLPRIAFSGSNTAGPGLLVEPTATNYYYNSRNPVASQVVNGGANLSAGQYTLWVNGYPTLGRTATLSGCATGTATQGVQFNFTLAAPAPCTVAATYSAGNGSDLISIQLENSKTATSYIPTLGASFIGNSSGTTNLTVTSDVGTITIGHTLVGPGVPVGTTIISQTSGTIGGNGVYVTSASTTIAGALVNTGIAGTRSADYILLKSTALSTAIGAAASVLVSANGTPNVGNVYVMQGDGYTLLQSTASTTISGLTPTLTATFGSGTIAGATKAATAFDGTGRSIVVNNGTVATDTNVPGANTAIALADTEAGAGNEYNGSIADMALWSSRLSNTTLQGLTVP